VLPEEAPVGPPVGFAVVGLGTWGREIVATLSQIPSARVLALCDTYAPFLRKASEGAPGAKPFADFRAVFDVPEVEGVVVATPSHRHAEIALATLQAGKHLYCEAPLATTVEDARAIAQAARASKVVFQGGLQGRSNALYRHVAQFVRSGVLGTPAVVNARWNRKDSWRRAAPTPEREAELNWRLSSATSPGLVGEMGIHALDLASFYLAAAPTAVTGLGSTTLWNDKRDVPDTVECVFEYPKGLRLVLGATLASSMGGAYSLFQGSNGSLMMREKRAWLIKEADSPLLGWEVYARKESVLDETGIALIADSTRILAAGQEPGQVGSAEPSKTPLRLAFEDFIRSVREGAKSACGPAEAFEATALALHANAAVKAGGRLEIAPEMLTLA